MSKIVILGCENTHANAFLNYIRDNARYKDVEVVGVYSDEEEAVKKLVEEYGVLAMQNYDEAVGKVDGVIVTARHGDNHYKYAKPYVESGVPMFIDKPITVNEAESVAFMQECIKYGVRVTGGSCCKNHDWVLELKKEKEENVGGKTMGGFVRAPINMNNVYGGFYFYSQHLVETVTTIFGYYPESVYARQNGKTISVLFHYDEFTITGLFSEESWKYYAMRQAMDGEKGAFFPVTGDNVCFEREFEEFYELLVGGKQKCTYEDFIAPVFILNAIERSMASGKEEKVNKFSL